MVDYCALAKEISNLTVLHVIDWIQLILSIIAVFVIVYTLHSYVRGSIFDRPFKELIYAHYTTIVVQSLCTMMDKASNIAMSFADGSCTFFIPKPFCIIRVGTSSTVAIFVVLHLAMSVKQSMSVFLVKESVQLRVTRPLIACSILYAIGFACYAFRNEKWSGQSAYCAALENVDREYLMINLYIMFGMDFCIACWLLGLRIYFQSRLKKEKSFNLATAFTRKQNLYAMKQFLPIASLHAAAYTIFSIIYTVSSILRPHLTSGQSLIMNNLSNIFPLYCVMCPLVLIRLVKRGKARREKEMQKMVAPVENETHFKELRQQWKSDAPTKESKV